MNGYKETLNKPVPENISREQGAMPQPMGSGHVDHGHQCEAKVRDSRLVFVLDAYYLEAGFS